MAQRDFSAEFDAYIAASLPETDYVAAVVAGEVVDKLRVNDPELLAGWLDMRAAVVVTDFIGSQQRSQRASASRGRGAAEFADAADRFKDGDSSALAPFSTLLVVTEENLRRRIGDMSKADHLFVAEQHVKRSEAALFEAAFHRAIAKRIPAGKTTRDVLSEEDYLKMRDSIRPAKRASAD